MPWNLSRDLHLDIHASYGRVLLVSATHSALLQPPPVFIAGDGMPCRVHFWERETDGTLTAVDPGAETSLVFSGRPAGAPSGSDLLFLTTDFVQISEGVWEGTLDLTTEEFATHLAASPTGPKVILGEVEVRDSIANTKRASFQFDITARPQVYNGEDAPLGLPGPDAWLEARRPAPLELEAVPTNGISQSERFTFTGEVTVAGDYTLTLTTADHIDSPVSFTLPVLIGDALPDLATAAVALLAADTGIAWAFDLTTDGASILLARHLPGDDATLNLALTAVDGEGLDEITDSTNDTAGVSGTVATALAQSAIVTHSDDTFTEWSCVSLEPMTWLPITAGILYNRDLSQWERMFINGTIQTEILPDQ